MTRPAPRGVAAPEREASQRLDKWLWYARVAKSRTLAAAVVAEGRIKVNRVKAAKASQQIKVGDVITSRLPSGIRILKVMGLGARRGPADEARGLYEDLTPPIPRNEAGQDALAWGDRAPGSGRPTKRDRRRLEEFKDGQ